MKEPLKLTNGQEVPIGHCVYLELKNLMTQHHCKNPDLLDILESAKQSVKAAGVDTNNQLALREVLANLKIWAVANDLNYEEADISASYHAKMDLW